MDLEGLLRLGRMLETEPGFGIYLADAVLRVRDRTGRLSALGANPVQAAFERDRQRENIVLKARQMGMTTWVAGQYFLKTITAPGVLTVQVAHTREAAESLFTHGGPDVGEPACILARRPAAPKTRECGPDGVR